jgi:hypothetical protein
MTKPKTWTKVKTGRKKRSEKAYQNKILKIYFDAKCFTPSEASFHAKCGYGYAVKKFQEFRTAHDKWLEEYNMHHPKYEVTSQMVGDFLIKQMGISRYKRFWCK